MTAMRETIARVLDSTRTVYAACLVSLVLGLAFIFVWAPHPWGWAGIDAYHVLALELARGEAFSTTDVPWGYAYFVAASYTLFGERTWVPLVVQAVANAFVPLMLYHLVAPLTDRRTAVLASLLAGVFSFNTLYASTQASDAMCTVLFMAALLCFARGYRTGHTLPFACAGLLSGLVPQFRPNLILLPLVAAAWYLWQRPRAWRKAGQMTVYLALVVAALSPWVVRNYRLIGAVMPTSTHGGEQLWYGTLQVGPYLENRALNPRTVFESSALDYSSLADQSIVVSADAVPCSPAVTSMGLVYWTDRDARRRTVVPQTGKGGTLLFEIPGQPDPTVLYYYFEAQASVLAGQPPVRFVTPLYGEADPFVSFVSRDHLGDLDRHGDVLDIFDLVRMTRHIAWSEPITEARKLDFDQDGTVTARDLAEAIGWVVPEISRGVVPALAIDTSADAATLRFADGSSLSIPRDFGGRQTDVEPRGELAGILISRWRSFASIAAARRPVPGDACLFVERVRFNDVFYRREPHLLGRYMALAIDNISRDPAAFALASGYRIVRLFIISGSDEVSRTQQFSSGAFAYAAGRALSVAYFVVFLAGVALAWWRRSALLALLLPIAYVPLTICFVLTNMRYTITVQPLMFAFVAVALVAAFGLGPSRDGMGDDEAGSPRG